MPREHHPEQLATEIRAVARVSGSLIIQSLIEYSKSTPRAVVDINEMIEIIRHTKPQILYLVEQHFAADELFEDPEVEKNPEAQALLRSSKNQEGKTARIVSSVIVGGVLNILCVDAPWYEEIENKATSIVQLVSPDINETVGAEAFYARREEKRRNSIEIISVNSKILAADPRFNAPKATKANREHLSSILFPDIDNELHGEIVEKANAIAWLNGTKSS